MDVQDAASREALQKEIDAIHWYHEFDFGGGLRAVSVSQAEDHRRIWRFIESELDKIDFSGKSVLEIGCWDGFWSFYAERRGAKRVLATDDVSQNWASGAGLRLAKKLLNSSVEINQSVSIYEASKLNETFDIILCLGVYYHLVDPFAGFAEVRHLMHEGSLAIFEGDATLELRPDTYYWDMSDSAKSCFVPTQWGLSHMLKTTYMDVVAQSWMRPPPAFKVNVDPAHLIGFTGALEPSGFAPLKHRERILTVVKPFSGENPLHPYKPPFNLAKFDTRWK
ncbi:bifunctional 2-polyprenyl-6-hydroxyphenol methylase/3-demethylubiquinol 3-O-methyltransferase UbiG [Methylocystis sp.]|uniref:class I SAM-dependent methyltransferase n=1 Tax=Methylocystis sp. TaxID=1911079 RepID=UPI0025FB1EDB|nr:class I SAM-dependent methyltransferase [Methylocystis sp.]